VISPTHTIFPSSSLSILSKSTQSHQRALASGSYKLAVNGSAAKPGGGTWSSFSDSRLKNVAGDYEYGLEEIRKLHPVKYSYKEGNALELPTDEEYVGLVAQEVREAILEAVEENDK
jgi:hypothetical protein